MERVCEIHLNTQRTNGSNGRSPVFISLWTETREEERVIRVKLAKKVLAGCRLPNLPAEAKEPVRGDIGNGMRIKKREVRHRAIQRNQNSVACEAMGEEIA